MVQGHVIFKNWYLCRIYWKDHEHKYWRTPTSTGVVAYIDSLLKIDQGNDSRAYSLPAAGRPPPKTPFLSEPDPPG